MPIKRIKGYDSYEKEVKPGYTNKCPYQSSNCRGPQCAHFIKVDEECSHVIMALSLRIIARHFAGKVR